MRAGAGWVAASAVLFLVSCTAASTPSPPTALGSRSVPRPTVVGAVPSGGQTFIDSQTLPCESAIDHQPAPPDWQIVLGVVALPAGPRAAALQAARTGQPEPALPLFAKAGLAIRTGVTFELVAPVLTRNRVGIGWAGEPSTPSRRVVVTKCADSAGTGWLDYPGGYWLDHPACIPLTVRSGTKEKRVSIGLGTACAGQRPPEGPSGP